MSGRKVLAAGSIALLVFLVLAFVSACEDGDKYYHVPDGTTETYKVKPKPKPQKAPKAPSFKKK